MTAGNEDQHANISSTLDANLYPDLFESGGLVSAMIQCSQANDMELGPVRPATESPRARFITAVADTDRGAIFIHLGARRRKFSISIEGDVHPWADGGTDDLLSAVKVVHVWRRGATLEKLKSDFPFMHYSELAKAYESGDPVATQWEQLLDTEEFSSVRAILQKVYADDRLRLLFPFFSHGTLRLARDYSDRTAGEIWISPLPDGHYRVESTKSNEMGEEAISMDQLIEIAISFLACP